MLYTEKCCTSQFFNFQEWGDFYDQGSSQSSTGGFSVNALTPSPSSLGAAPTPTMINPYEKINSPQNIQQSSNEISPFRYINNIGSYNPQTSPVKLIPLNDDAISDFALDFYSSPGVSPLKSNEVNRHFTKTRKFVI